MVKRALLVCLLSASVAWAQGPEGATTSTSPPPTTTAPAAPPAVGGGTIVEEPAIRPIAKRPIFWIAIAGGVAIAVAGITLAVVLNPPHDPTATWGVGVGN